MTNSNRTTGGDMQAHLGRRQWAMLIILTLSSFIVVLDFASVFIPLPTIMEGLGGTLDEATWVIAGFTLAFAVFLLPCSTLADLYGRRRLFLSGVTVFTVASLICALAPSIEFLIGARFVLGIGAAMIETAVFALIKNTIPDERQGLAFKVQGIAFVGGALVAPILSGSITTVLSWEYIFWLNVLVGVVVVAVALRVVPESRVRQVSRKLDIPGLVSGGIGLFFLVFAIIEGSRFGWNSPLILGSFGGAAILLTLFVAIERRVHEPLFDLNLLNDRLFTVGNILRSASEFASMGIFFAISHFLQVQLGHSALIAGLLLMSVIVGGILIAPITEFLSGRIEVRWLVIPGFLLTAGGTFWLAHISPESGWTFFLAPLAIAGAGFVAQEGPTVSARDRDVPPAQSDAAWRVSYSIFLMGIGLGVSVVSAVWQSQFVSNMKQTLEGTDLSYEVADRIFSSLLKGGMSGQPAAEISGSNITQQLIQVAFANAINAALLCCAAAALLGAIVALFFYSNQEEKTTAEVGENDGASQ